MAFATQEDIGNRALQHCGARRIAAFADNSRNAQEVAFYLGIMKLHPVAYRVKDSGNEHHFFTAEEVNEVFPSLVGKDADGRPNNVDYVGLITKLVAMSQNQQREINELKSLVGSSK